MATWSTVIPPASAVAATSIRLTTSPGPDALHAEQPPRRRVGHELEDHGLRVRVVVRLVRPRHRRRHDRDPQPLRLRLGQARPPHVPVEDLQRRRREHAREALVRPTAFEPATRPSLFATEPSGMKHGLPAHDAALLRAVACRVDVRVRGLSCAHSRRCRRVGPISSPAACASADVRPDADAQQHQLRRQFARAGHHRRHLALPRRPRAAPPASRSAPSRPAASCASPPAPPSPASSIVSSCGSISTTVTALPHSVNGLGHLHADEPAADDDHERARLADHVLAEHVGVLHLLQPQDVAQVGSPGSAAPPGRRRWR